MAYSNSWVNSTASTSLAVVTSPTIHDVLIAWATTDTSGATFTWPSGFTQIASQATTADGQQLGVAIKNDATGSEGTLTIGCTVNCIGGVIAHSGRDNTTPQAFTASVVNNNTGQASPWTLDSGSVTPSANGTDLVAVMGSDVQFFIGDVAHTFSTPTGTTGAWTTRQDPTTTDGTRDYGVGTATQVTAGAITVRGTGTRATDQAGRAMILVGLKPAASGVTYTLTAAAATFTLSGQVALLKFNRAVPAASGSFTLSGKAVTFTHGYTLTAAKGTFTLSGIAASLAFNRAISAAKGTFTLTGISAGTLFNRALSAAKGTFTLTGNAVGFTYTPAGAYNLAAASGTFTLTGKAAALTYTPTPGSLDVFFGGGFFPKRRRRIEPEEALQVIEAAGTEPQREHAARIDLARIERLAERDLTQSQARLARAERAWAMHTAQRILRDRDDEEIVMAVLLMD